MSRITKQFIGILLFCGAFALDVQAQWLSELIDSALVNNYQIKILRNSAEMSQNNNSWGNAGLLPTVQLNGGLSTSFNNTQQEFADGSTKQGTGANTSNMNLALLVNWTVFDGFGVYARKDRFEYLEEIGQLNTKYYIEQTVADIVTVYYQLVYEKSLKSSFAESMAISFYRLKLEEQRNLVGSGSLADYGQALVAYQSDSIRFLEQQSNIDRISIEFNRILNRDLESTFGMSEDSPSFDFVPIPTRDSLFALIEQNSQALKIQLLNELVSESEIRIEKANRYPKIDIYGGYQFSQATAEVGFINLNRNLGPTLGLNVNFNLYNGGKTKIAIENAQLNSENASLNREQVNKNLDAEILSLYQQYQSISERIALALSNAEMMQKVYGVAKQQLQEGAINGYDFRVVQLSLLNAEIALLQQRFALKLVEVSVNRIAGKALNYL